MSEKIFSENNMEIIRDSAGIPYAKATSEEDLYFLMGYCHAMDRGLQMLLMRVLGYGKASELLDPSDEMLKVDIFFRKMNFYKNTEKVIKNLSEKAQKICEQYCKGVNKYFSLKTPWEFKLTGYKPEPWKTEDSIMMSRMIGYLTLAQSQFEIERLFIEMVKNGISKEKLEQLFPDILVESDFELIKQLKISENIVPEIKWNLMIPKFMASNNWVVSGSKTKSGKPILANDPHLETNRLPNVWYEIVLQTSENYSYTATMPGLPGCLLARTNTLSWGATYTFLDSTDSWIEECNKGKYKDYDGNWKEFEKRIEVIKRKNKNAHSEIFYENSRGTLDGTPSEDGYYLTTRWFPDSSGSNTLNAISEMFKAKNVTEGKKLLGQIETSWNWVLVDTEGNIGYQMSGLMPKRKAGISGFVPLPGWLEENNWKEFYSYEDLPNITNPENGYFVTANNNLNRYGKVNPINICMSEYRAERISDLLKNKNDLTTEDMKKFHYDLYSIQAEKFMKIILPLLPENDYGKILKEWDFCYNENSKGAYLFEKIYKNLYREVFGNNLPVEYLISETGIFIDFFDNFDKILLSENSLWFNGKSREDIYNTAIRNALKFDIKEWKDNQSLTLTNIFFGGKLPGFLGFDKGPIVLKGGRATIHQGQIYRSGGRDTSFAPSFRFISDMSENLVYSNMAGGPSDRRFSKWYTSDLDNWLNKKYKCLKLK